MLLNSRRGNSLVTYIALVLVYCTLMGLVLYPQHQTLIGAVGLLLLIGLLVLLQVWNHRQRARSLLPGLPSYSPQVGDLTPGLPGAPITQTLIRPASSPRD
jgi:PPM family protein phosphatase